MELLWILNSLTPQALIDILLVALLFFGLSFFLRGTQAVALLRSLVLALGSLVLIANLFDFLALRWLLEALVPVLIVAIPIIFQPELRRAIGQLSRFGIIVERQPDATQSTGIIEAICQAAEKLSERRHGALIVLERKQNLEEYVRTGIALNCDVSPQLLLTVFWPKTELHDGAVIIDGSGRIAAAAAVLPLSSSRNITAPKLGTRHRAALGVTEVSDAVCVVISEETGRISITNAGRMIARLDTSRLRTILNAFYGPERSQQQSLWQQVRDFVQSWLDRVRDQQPSV
ncbi:MAG: TIGR00159 family protein [Chloroflexi bacterium]|nr:TIGR00159 family protein [Chloroflexota bacterium]